MTTPALPAPAPRAAPAEVALRLVQPAVPGVPDYVVVHLGEPDDEPPPEVMAQLLAQSHALAQRMSRERFGDPGCYSMLVNGPRTRRTRGAHVHIVLTPSLSAKRRSFFLLQLKHLTRPIAAALRWLSRRSVTAG